MSQKLVLGEDNSGDSPELAEYKKKVREVAAAHSAKYHCGGMGKVLKDLDIREPALTAKVIATTSHPLQFTVTVNIAEFNGLKDADAQKAHLSELINLRLQTQLGNALSVTIPASSITEVKKAPEPELEEPVPGESLPTSSHSWPGYSMVRDGLNRQTLHLHRGNIIRSGVYAYAACGALPIRGWSPATQLSGDVVCDACQAAAARLNR